MRIFYQKIGDYLLTLPQQLEPFITQDNPGLAAAMKAGNLPFPDIQGIVVRMLTCHQAFSGAQWTSLREKLASATKGCSHTKRLGSRRSSRDVRERN